MDIHVVTACVVKIHKEEPGGEEKELN